MRLRDLQEVLRWLWDKFTHEWWHFQRVMQADTATLPFPARFSSICYNYNSLSRERGRVGRACARVSWSTNATTVRTDRLQYVRMNTSQRTPQKTVHYCLITICLWDRGFKPGSDPAGDSCPTWFHSAVRCLQQQWKVFSISDTKRL